MATRNFCDDDVPPLEDCTELLEQMKMSGSLSEKTISTINSEKTFHHDNQCNNLGTEAREINQTDLKSKKPQTFGGFQKGFLTNLPTRKSTKKSTNEHENTIENVPLIKAKNPTTSNPLAIPEVQEAMKTQSPLLQNTDWLNNELMQKLQDNPVLLKKLLDPKCQKAITTIQSNTQKGQELLAGDKELQDLFKDLSTVLGDHFTQLAEQDEYKKVPETSDISATDEQAMSKILSDKEVVEALKDPWISKLVANLKNNPEEARRMLARMKPEYLSKVHKLVKAGILSFG